MVCDSDTLLAIMQGASTSTLLVSSALLTATLFRQRAFNRRQRALESKVDATNKEIAAARSGVVTLQAVARGQLPNGAQVVAGGTITMTQDADGKRHIAFPDDMPPEARAELREMLAATLGELKKGDN